MNLTPSDKSEPPTVPHSPLHSNQLFLYKLSITYMSSVVDVDAVVDADAELFLMSSLLARLIPVVKFYR